jgi:2-C-methyl-D-erythritol 4-phosphate cytidylyltransferase
VSPAAREGLAAVVVAGGSGRRIGGVPKQFREVGGRPVLAWSCARFRCRPDVDQLVVVLPAKMASSPPAWLDEWDVRVAVGGSSRRASVRSGLAALDGEASSVFIHDAARPFVSDALLDRLAAAVPRGPVIPVLPLADTIKRLRSRQGEDAEVVESTVDRERLRAVQTPQAFPVAVIRDLHERAEREGTAASDDAVLCEREGIAVRTVPGERWAWKITHDEDLALAEWLVASGRVRWPGDGA